jgi:hypothetical protein
MPVNSLYPAFVVIDYHSPYGSHKMTLPTREWTDEVSAGGSGTFDAWTSAPRDAHDMVNDLANLIKPFFKPACSFDQYTIYTMSSPTAAPQPVAAQSLGIDGTSAQTAWDKAVQTTFSFRTSDFGTFKLVLLDAPCGNNFDKILSFDASPEAVAIFDYLKSDDEAWAGRDGGHINVMTQIAYTLNEKLRREYGMN